MSAPNKQFSKTVRVLLLGAPLILAACTSDFGPFPMPTGYRYHNDVYRTPPGPEPVFKKIEHMHDADTLENCPDPVAHQKATMAEPVMDTTMVPASVGGVSAVPVMPALSVAANDLVQRVVDQFGRPVEPVYITPSAGSAREIGFEKALRAALADQGFNIAPAPGIGPFTLDYTIGMPGSVGGRSMVKIILIGQEGTLSEQSGLYDLGAPEMDSSMAPPPVMSMHEELPEPEVPASQGAPTPLGPD